MTDNETNFRGTETEIKTTLEHWNLDRNDNCLRRREIRWNFNPPHASHTGGVWEQMIRSIRKILRLLLGSQIMDDETLLTCMTEVEKILNDRPLTLPRQVIRTILSFSLQVNYSSCGQTYVFLLENQTLQGRSQGRVPGVPEPPSCFKEPPSPIFNSDPIPARV